jgi:hypothetical protein
VPAAIPRLEKRRWVVEMIGADAAAAVYYRITFTYQSGSNLN